MNNQELTKEIQALREQVTSLQSVIDDMKRSSSFPIEIKDAIAESISDMNFTIATANIQRTLSLSGLAQDVPVFAEPDGFRVFKVGGKDYYIPYYLNS